jgi:hypothetical protein
MDMVMSKPRRAPSMRAFFDSFATVDRAACSILRPLPRQVKKMTARTGIEKNDRSGRSIAD